MASEKLKFSFDYSDTSERKCVSLESDGVRCLPVVGYDAFRRIVEASPFHVHEECLEISLCLRGDLAFEMEEGGIYPFKPGNVFVSRPRERHRLQAHPRNLSKYWIMFRIPTADAPLLGLPRAEAKWLRATLLDLPRSFGDDGGRVKAAFQRLFRVYEGTPRGTPERRLLIREAALALFIALAEVARQPAKIQPDARLKRILAEIETSPEKPYPVDQLAVRAAVSETGLLQGFKRLTGMPPHAFILHCRVKKAKVELETGTASVSEIARRLGFPSPQHFATTFRKLTGVRPSEWKGQK